MLATAPKSKPLSTQAFYVLLALARTDYHAYALKSAVFRDSLGAVSISTGRLYALIGSLHDEGLIEIAGHRPTNRSGVERQHYALSQYGAIYLQEELKRLDHALAIGRAAHLMDNPIPTDLQMLLLNVAQDAKSSNT